MMSNKKKIAANLQSALSGQRSLSIDLYGEVLASYEDELRASLEKDADDTLLCMLDDDGDVAMMVIDWDGSIYRNEHALKKLRAMRRRGYRAMGYRVEARREFGEIRCQYSRLSSLSQLLRHVPPPVRQLIYLIAPGGSHVRTHQRSSVAALG